MLSNNYFVESGPPLLKILIVDDFAADVLNLRRMLSSTAVKSSLPPFEIYTVDTIRKALIAYQVYSPDCILLDYNLPDMTGLELVQMILESEGKLTSAIVMMTGAGDENIAVQAMKLGVHDYLVKGSVTSEQLGWTIHSALERLNLYAQIADKQEELELFASRAAHDMVSPLTNLALFVEHLQDQMPFDSMPDSADTMESILSIVDHMSTLINGLSTYAQVGRINAPVEPVNLQELFEYILLVFEAEIVETKATITANNLPTISGDRAGIAQLLQNLIGNALKYRSTTAPVINLTAQPIGTLWRISVIDNGIGIDPKYHQEIFMPFKRLHSRAEFPGSGLGLATCYKVIMQHGGDIWVESELGMGTTIHIMLPEIKNDTSRRTSLPFRGRFEDASPTVHRYEPKLNWENITDSDFTDTRIQKLSANL